MLSRVSQPWAPIEGANKTSAEKNDTPPQPTPSPSTVIKTTKYPTVGKSVVPPNEVGIKQVMRKHMTNIYEELMTQYPQMIYLGEDVVHGGYYLVSDGLAKKFPIRVRDFPPEEGCIIGY